MKEVVNSERLICFFWREWEVFCELLLSPE
jgi:hypothetical protein